MQLKKLIFMTVFPANISIRPKFSQISYVGQISLSVAKRLSIRPDF